MITIYGDVAGKAENDRFITAACYLGLPLHWAAFDRQWGLALKQAKVDEFHATDFFKGYGEFEGDDWHFAAAGGERRTGGPHHRRFAKWFCRIAQRLPIGFSLTIEVKPFNRLLRPELKGIRTPHGKYTPLMEVVLRVIERAVAMSRGRPEPIAVIFEREPGLGEVVDHFQMLKDNGEPWTQRIQSFTRERKSLRPLQAADLFAYEAWQRCCEAVKPTPRALRKSLGALLCERKIEVKFCGEKYYRETVPKVRAFLEAHPSGLLMPPT